MKVNTVADGLVTEGLYEGVVFEGYGLVMHVIFELVATVHVHRYAPHAPLVLRLYQSSIKAVYRLYQGLLRLYY